MAYALVGSRGALGTSASGAALTPAWGAGSSRTAGNLLICWYSASGGFNTPPTPFGWSVVFTGSASPSAAVYYKIAAGADAAPAFSAVAGNVLSAALAEFSGNTSSAPLDVTTQVIAGASTSPQTLTATAADAQVGELFCTAWGLWYSTAATKTFTHTMNNGMTANSLNSSATSTVSHCNFSYGIPTSNAVADSDQLAYTTTKITSVGGVGASFLLPAAAAEVIPDLAMGLTVT